MAIIGSRPFAGLLALCLLAAAASDVLDFGRGARICVAGLQRVRISAGPSGELREAEAEPRPPRPADAAVVSEREREL